MFANMQRVLSHFTGEPAIHWSACEPAALADCFVIEPALARASLPTLAAPQTLGPRAALRLASPIGTTDRNLVRFVSARLVSQTGILELSDGSLLAEPAWHPDIVTPWLQRATRPARRRRQRGPWFSCLLAFAPNYYHWMCDVLPRLYDVLERLPRDTRFVVPHDMTAWQRDSLAAVGIDASRCASLPLDEAWSFDELYYSAPVAVCGDHERNAVAWLRDTITNSIAHTSTPRTRLYVTRRHARRRLVNEDEYWPVFADAGFTMIAPELLSFHEQVARFAAAECVVGVHGAGMANVLWAPRGIKVAEIFSPAFATQRCIWTLASALDHDYRAAMAEDVDVTTRDMRWTEALVRELVDFAATAPVAAKTS